MWMESAVHWMRVIGMVPFSLAIVLLILDFFKPVATPKFEHML